MARCARLVICVALVAAGCNGSSDPEQDGGLPGSDSKLSGDCPAYLPQADEACAREGLSCDYGTDAQCLATARCVQGKWQLAIPSCPGSAASCPATHGEATGQDCATKDETCDYSGLACTCTNCIQYPVASCSGPLTWHCDAPNPDPDCPHARPAVGTACPRDGQFCNYGCEPDVSRECQGGTWAEASAPGGCPISTRRAKRDIHYLDDTERARIAAQARELRLATYRYRDPARDLRSHLGIILEDSPRCAAADMQRLQVDLYAYTSMVLALAQEQQHELEALKREIKRLRSQLRRAR